MEDAIGYLFKCLEKIEKGFAIGDRNFTRIDRRLMMQTKTNKIVSFALLATAYGFYTSSKRADELQHQVSALKADITEIKQELDELSEQIID